MAAVGYECNAAADAVGVRVAAIQRLLLMPGVGEPMRFEWTTPGAAWRLAPSPGAE